MNIEYGLLNDNNICYVFKNYIDRKKRHLQYCFVDFDEIDEFQQKKLFDAYRKKWTDLA